MHVLLVPQLFHNRYHKRRPTVICITVYLESRVRITDPLRITTTSTTEKSITIVPYSTAGLETFAPVGWRCPVSSRGVDEHRLEGFLKCLKFYSEVPPARVKHKKPKLCTKVRQVLSTIKQCKIPPLGSCNRIKDQRCKPSLPISFTRQRRSSVTQRRVCRYNLHRFHFFWRTRIALYSDV